MKCDGYDDEYHEKAIFNSDPDLILTILTTVYI